MAENISVILIHGFGGGPHEVAPLASHLESLGFEVVNSILAGHGGSRRNMKGATSEDWIRSVESDYLRLRERSEKIVLAGFSTGGLIAANLALKYPVAGVITISTPIYVWNIGRIIRNVAADARAGSLESLKFYMHSATSFPLSSLLQFKILQYRTRKIFPMLSCPLYVLQGLDDDTVHHKSADFIYRHSASEYKRIDYFERSGHVMLCGPSSADAIGKIASFIETLQ